MPKLNDTQLILLSTASQREGGSFYPLPATLGDSGGRATKAIAALMKHGFAEERETREPTSVHRFDGDVRYGLFITEAGIAALDGEESVDSRASAHSILPAALPRVSKTSAVLELLKREDGAFISELIAATGWLPHSMRAALTGLRKKGHVIERGKRDDQTYYRIAAAA